jgi:hypothetical protein
MARSKNSTDEHATYIRTARALAEVLYADRQEPITIEDVTDSLPLPQGMGYQVLGSVFRRPEWVRVAFKDSRYRPNGVRPIACFIPGAVHDPEGWSLMIQKRNQPDERTIYVRTARALAEFLYIDRGEPITIEDVTDNMPLPEGMGHHVLGGIFKAPRWQHAGYKTSRDRSNGRRGISCFVLAQGA